MSELHIPDKAVRVLAEYTQDIGGMWSGTAKDDIRQIAAPVVAAELRRLAGVNGIDPSSTGCHREDADLLLARADELDPQGGAQ